MGVLSTTLLAGVLCALVGVANSASQGFIFLGLLLLVELSSQALTLMVTSATGSAKSALSAACAGFMLNDMLSGASTAPTFRRRQDRHHARVGSAARRLFRPSVGRSHLVALVALAVVHAARGLPSASHSSSRRDAASATARTFRRYSYVALIANHFAGRTFAACDSDSRHPSSELADALLTDMLAPALAPNSSATPAQLRAAGVAALATLGAVQSASQDQLAHAGAEATELLTSLCLTRGARAARCGYGARKPFVDDALPHACAQRRTPRCSSFRTCQRG